MNKKHWLALAVVAILVFTMAACGQNMTAEQEKALESAKNYLDLKAFSYDGLVKQLVFEGHAEEDAKYAADNCGADWNEQAVKAAKAYIEINPAITRDLLIKTLTTDGFTEKQAEHGADKNGF